MVEALLLGLVAFIAQSEYALGTSLISRPIVTGLLTGLVLGDMETGIVMGATLGWRLSVPFRWARRCPGCGHWRYFRCGLCD